MCVIVYDKNNNNKVISIIEQDIDFDELPPHPDNIVFSKDAPYYDRDWQKLIIKNGEVVVTNLELNPNQKISIYKKYLKNTDYKAIKYAEGLMSEEEYAPIREERQQWRTKINQLEEELNIIYKEY